MESILLPKAIDVSKLTYGNLRNLESGGKVVYIGYDGKPLYIQTPEMVAPFGMSTWNADKSYLKDKHTIEMSFKGKENRASLQYFYGFLEQMDNKIIDDAMSNAMTWFKKKFTSREVVEAVYTPMLKFPKDKDTGEITDKYPPTFRICPSMTDNKFACDVYDKNKQPISISNVEKGSKVTAILQCLGLWIAGGKFGCTWKVVQMKVVNPPSIKGFAFKDTDDDNKCESGSDIDELGDGDVVDGQWDSRSNDVINDDVDDENTQDTKVDPKVDDTIVESSDDEEEVEKPKVKKVIARKKTTKA